MATTEHIQSVIEDIQRDQEQMRETMNMIAMAIPSLRVEQKTVPVTESDGEWFLDPWDAEQPRASRNEQAILGRLRRLDPSTNYTLADAQHATRVGCRVLNRKKALRHNTAAVEGTVTCRLPTDSQFSTWVALNIDEVERFDFDQAQLLNIVIAIANLQTQNINFRERDNDELAMRWLSRAWEWLPKTRRTTNEGFPF